MFARVAARLDGIFLIIAVDRFLHAFEQQAFVVGCQQRVPIGAPDDFDDVPAGAAKKRFEFLNDLAVAAHRAVETLQIAIDDPDQIVEIFARRQRESASDSGSSISPSPAIAPDFRFFAGATDRGSSGNE